ncbi:inositol oxygenase [Parasteatoda tepidariorum]|uniref:inositol oxygenase n=1 Tax=Parasteatoda tepidariorum TaxID=114398 RepID=UPI00077FDB6F|nr:inositol oxygenase [Parasteatoda tepidariorum]
MGALAVQIPPCVSEITDPILMLDPSELYRPEINKGMDEFREYSDTKNDPIQLRVRETYRKMHTHQTLDFVKEKIAYWTKFNKARLTVMEALEKLNCLVDESDPDVDIPNNVHAFQTAERIRQAHPTLDWFHLTGLVHDLGKLMALYGEPQWCVVGDTFPVGCAFAPSIVYRNTSFSENPDLYNPNYNTRLGIYSENCGLENVIMSWGHDEYMYQALKHNKCTIPEEGLYMIRFHSFYPWHLNGDYDFLCNEKDRQMHKWVTEFNKFDLYSKSHDIPDIKELMPYYQSLIDKYMPGVLEW